MEQWTALAMRARNGDREVLGELVDVAYGPIRRLCATLVDEESADDLAQETFLQVAKGIRRFRGDSSGRTWLFAIAHHVCASALRSRIRHREHTEPAGDLDLAQVPSTSDPSADAVANDVLRRIDPDRRAAFVLTQIYGMSYDEAADICGCASGTIGSRVARARDDLIRLLAVDDQPNDLRPHSIRLSDPSATAGDSGTA
jgi:RNA polymerase sigma-70 factor (ECF subfamily)